MKKLITGHRLFKLVNYDIEWIKFALEEALSDPEIPTSFGYSGMASGVDLWFCQICLALGIPYEACVPFEDQQFEMEEDERQIRSELIRKANKLSYVRNRYMVEKAQPQSQERRLCSGRGLIRIRAVK